MTPTIPTRSWLELDREHVSDRQGIPNSKVHGANMGHIWGRQDPGGPHVGPRNWDVAHVTSELIFDFL